MLQSPAPDILLPGTILSNGRGIKDLLPEIQHLSCFTGGMFALGGRLFTNDSHVSIGARLARGCAWAYESFPAGIMPELAEVVACPGTEACEWDEGRWEEASLERGLPRPWTSVRDGGWRLRPEAVESLFVMWRVAGEEEWVERAWRMWEAVEKAAGGEDGVFAMVEDVRVEGGRRVDSMEVSFPLLLCLVLSVMLTETELLDCRDVEIFLLDLFRPGRH